LKTVANPDDQFTIAQKPAQGLLKSVAQLGSQDDAGRNIIAKGEAARQGENVKRVELLGLGNEVAHMDQLSVSADTRQIEGVRGFAFAIDAIAGENQDTGTFHRGPFMYDWR
jgi:hypothetical protein